MNVAPGATFEAYSPALASGLAGTVGVRIRDGQGADTLARTTTSISADVVVGSTTIYRRSLTAPTTAGQYWIVWDDGTNIANPVELVVTYTTATVSTSSLYVTRDELKEWIDIDGSWDDDAIDLVCETASRAIDGIKDTRFYPTNETRYYTGAYWEQELGIEDLVSVTAVTVDTDGNGSYDQTWVQDTDFYLDPTNAALVGQPYKRLILTRQAGRSFPTYARSVKVEGVFGWSEVPSLVRQAAKILAARLLKRSETPNAIQTVGGDVAVAMRLGKFDPDVMSLLDALPGSRVVLFV